MRIEKHIVFSYNGFSYIFFSRRTISHGIMTNMLNNALRPFNKFYYLFFALFFIKVINHFIMAFFSLGCPDYFLNHLLYFFITSSCERPTPFFDSVIPFSKPFLTSSGIISHKVMVSSAKVFTTVSTAFFFLSDKCSK